MQLGDYLGAVADYTRVLERHPGAEIHTHRGWAYFFADAWRPALDDFEKPWRWTGPTGMRTRAGGWPA